MSEIEKTRLYGAVYEMDGFIEKIRLRLIKAQMKEENDMRKDLDAIREMVEQRTRPEITMK